LDDWEPGEVTLREEALRHPARLPRVAARPRHRPAPQGAGGWCAEAFHWYDYRHHHASIAHFTTAEVHTGRHLALREVRQRALDRAWDLHPERFVRGRPVAEAVPREVWINRPEQEPAKNVPQAAAS